MSSMKPKRRIERVFSRVLASSVGTSAESNTLYTADDAVTMIRVLIRGRAWVTTDSVTTRFAEWVLRVNPRGQAVASSPDTTEALDQDVPLPRS